MTPSQKRALDQYMANVEAFKGGKPLAYEVGEDLNLEELSPEELSYLQSGGYDSIATDSRYKDAELAALADLEERSKGSGLTKQDEADMFRLHQQVNSQNRGRVGAIKDNMATRGLGGSGMEAMLQLQSAQDAAEREALMAMEKAGQAQAGKRDATSRLGQLSSSLQGRDFDQEMAKRQAEESIKRFNAANRNTQLNRNVDTRNQATQSNWSRANQTADNNVSSANQRSAQVYNATQDGASMAYNAATEDANRKMLDEQERRRRRQALIAGVLGAGGAVAGGVLGSAAGPAGTVAGAGVGASAGQAFGNGVGGYAYGGIVGFPEDELSGQDTLPPSLPLDHPSNDVVPAKLSKGEVVVPRSVVADTFADPTNQSLNEYMNRLKAAVVEKQKAANDAKTMDQVASYGSIFTSLLNDFNAGRRRQAVLHNRMDQLGKSPTVSKDEVTEVKDLAGPMAKANLQEAKSDLESARKDLITGPAEYAAIKSSDPSSEESKLLQGLASKLMPNKDFSTYSANQLKTAIPILEKMYALDNRRGPAASNRYEMKLDDYGIPIVHDKQTGEIKRGWGAVPTELKPAAEKLSKEGKQGKEKLTSQPETRPSSPKGGKDDEGPLQRRPGESKAEYNERIKAKYQEGKSATESQAKSSAQYQKLVDAEAALAKSGGISQKSLEALDRQNKQDNLWNTGLGNLVEATGIVRRDKDSDILTPQEQVALQAQRQWADSYVRNTSGAVVGERELTDQEVGDRSAAAMKTFFPQVGDSPEVIKRKEQARQAAMQSVYSMTRDGSKGVPPAPQPAQQQPKSGGKPGWAK